MTSLGWLDRKTSTITNAFVQNTNIWASTSDNVPSHVGQNEESNQPAHPRNLIRVSKMRPVKILVGLRESDLNLSWAWFKKYWSTDVLENPYMDHTITLYAGTASELRGIGGNSFKSVTAPFWKGSTLKGKNLLCSRREQIRSFQSRLIFRKGLMYWKASRKSQFCLPCQNMVDNLPSVSFTLTLKAPITTIVIKG